jgi:hypothetical protein
LSASGPVRRSIHYLVFALGAQKPKWWGKEWRSELCIMIAVELVRKGMLSCARCT